MGPERTQPTHARRVTDSVNNAYTSAARPSQHPAQCIWQPDPNLEPIYYDWHKDPEVRERRRRRAISTRDFNAEVPAAYLRQGIWPPPGPGNWGPKPQASSAAPEKPFIPAESIDECIEDCGVTEAESDINEGPERQPDYPCEPLPHDTQDSLKTASNPSEPATQEPQDNWRTDADQFAPATQESQDSWKTTSTLPIPSGDKGRFNWQTHHLDQHWQPCQTGPLVADDPRFSMDETATQQAAIPPTDPNGRNGSHAFLRDEDRADILCILSPGSPAAYQAIELVASTTPQHILQNHLLKDNLTRNEHRPDEDKAQPDPMTVDKDENPQASKPSLDIALRMSSRLLNPCLGFTFGRNPEKVDLLICTKDTQMRVSGAHFRIYITNGGVLMCQDTSTNGTVVDTHYLQQKSRSDPNGQKRTLHGDSTIELMFDGGHSMRFFVSVPDREGVSEVYGRRLDAYIDFVAQYGRQKKEEFNCKTKGIPIEVPSVPILPFDHGLLDKKLSSHANKNLVAGTEPYHYGMQWSGGHTYKVIGYIGKGAFAAVYKLARRHDGVQFAVKEIGKTVLAKKGVVDRRVEQELAIMKRLEHPNIVQYIGHHETKDHLYIIMELVRHGDLQSYLNGGQPRFQEHFCRAVATQMCEALKYLHDRKITHRDIKPDNILVSSDDPYIFKLSDFGLSKVVNSEETFLRSFCGTLLYCAPEVYPGYDRLRRHSRKRLRAPDGSFIKSEAKKPYTSAVDTWGLAAVLYHLLCGSPPFTGAGINHGGQMLHTIMNTPVDYGKLRLGGVSEYAIDFLKRMLVTDPASRLSDNDCLEHPWITQKVRDKGPQQDFEAWTQTRPEDYATRDTERANEEELNTFASQLSIVDRHAYRLQVEEEELPSEELAEVREMSQSKRKRQDEDDFEEEPSLAGYDDDLAPSDSPPQAAQQQPKRLFGEVTRSALQSSGALDWQANAALEVDAPGNRNPSSSESHYAGESQLSIADYPKAQEEPGVTYPRLRVDPSGAAPSLLGAEAMVGQLNMDSVLADAPAPNTDGQSTTPKTRGYRAQSPQIQAVGHQSTASSQGLYSATPPQSVHHPKEPTASGHKPGIPKTKHKKHDTNDVRSLISQHTSKHPDYSRDHPTSPTALVSNQQVISKPAPAANPNEDKQQAPTSTTQVQPVETQSSPVTKASGTAVRATTGLPSAYRPIPITVLGTLTTLPGSINYPTIYLTKRDTSFGRAANDYPWPDRQDIRIPKWAFDIFFWRRGIDRELATNPDVDWRAYEDIQACITTRTSQSISINGVRLEKGKGCLLYGILCSGDIITVLEPMPGADMTKLTAREKENLKFKVEILIGKSRERRKEGEFFQVIKEKLTWEQHKEGKKSREGSVQTTASQASGKTGDTAAGSQGSKTGEAKVVSGGGEQKRTGEKSTGEAGGVQGGRKSTDGRPKSSHGDHGKGGKSTTTPRAPPAPQGPKS